MEARVKTQDVCIHQLARVFYWLSILLLLCGMWMLISPFNRKAGETEHIYITLLAFEVYMWMLLYFGRWQISRLLNSDAARAGIFTIILTGFLYIALSELHLAAGVESNYIAVLALGLSIAKLIIASKWYDIPLPGFMIVFSVLWLLAIVLPVPVMYCFADDKPAQHILGFLGSCGLAVFVGLHLICVRLQRSRGFAIGSGTFDRWWVPWLIVSLLAILACAGMYTSMYSLNIDWAQWYFSPVYLAIAVVAVALSHSVKRMQLCAWSLVGMACVFGFLVQTESVPNEMPEDFLYGLTGYLLHPVYPGIIYASLLFVVVGIMLRQWWMFLPAIFGCLGFVIIGTTGYLWKFKLGKGIVMLIWSFILLIAGVALQWAQERWQLVKPKVVLETQNVDAGVIEVSIDDKEV